MFLLVLAYPGSPGQNALNDCVCVWEMSQKSRRSVGIVDFTFELQLCLVECCRLCFVTVLRTVVFIKLLQTFW